MIFIILLLYYKISNLITVNVKYPYCSVHRDVSITDLTDPSLFFQNTLKIIDILFIILSSEEYWNKELRIYNI